MKIRELCIGDISADDGFAIMHLQYPQYPIFNVDSVDTFLKKEMCERKARRCAPFLESSIAIANAAIESIRVDSKRSYGGGE